MKNEPCTYCGENKWENREKHLEEVSRFLQEKLEQLKNPAAVALGRLGGKASAAKMTKAQRKARATKASHSRKKPVPKDI